MQDIDIHIYSYSSIQSSLLLLRIIFYSSNEETAELNLNVNDFAAVKFYMDERVRSN